MNFTGILLLPRTNRQFSEAFLSATLSAQTYLDDKILFKKPLGFFFL